MITEAVNIKTCQNPINLNYELPASAYYAVDPCDSRAQGIRKEALQMVKDTPLAPYVTEDNVASDSVLLTSTEEQLVVGGMACIWSEFVWDPTTLEFRCALTLCQR